MICKNCGTNMPDNVKFCFNCGAALSAEPVAPVVPAEPDLDATIIANPVDTFVTPAEPETPVVPAAQPVAPAQPEVPVYQAPAAPVQPVTPAYQQPVVPAAPVTPVTPAQQPVQAYQPPVAPVAPTNPYAPVTPQKKQVNTKLLAIIGGVVAVILVIVLIVVLAGGGSSGGSGGSGGGGGSDDPDPKPSNSVSSVIKEALLEDIDEDDVKVSNLKSVKKITEGDAYYQIFTFDATEGENKFYGVGYVIVCGNQVDDIEYEVDDDKSSMDEYLDYLKEDAKDSEEDIKEALKGLSGENNDDYDEDYYDDEDYDY